MKLTEYRKRAINYLDILQDPDTEIFVMTKLEDGSGYEELHKVVAVLFGDKQIIFTCQEGVCPPELESPEGTRRGRFQVVSGGRRLPKLLDVEDIVNVDKVELLKNWTPHLCDELRDLGLCSEVDDED